MIDDRRNAVGTTGIGVLERERQPKKMGDTRSSALRPRKSLTRDSQSSKKIIS